jgi:molybdopterin-guanine dinucleotide biosynthesis protein A
MGRPKALLPFEGEPLIAHMVRKLKGRFSEAIIVAAPDQELPVMPAVLTRDQVAYQGPVSGIYHGLKASSRELCFVTSCDAPFLNLALISHLVSQIVDYDVVVPFWEDRYQPLHAVYRRSVVPLLREQLDRNELRPIFLYDKVRTRKVTEEEIRWFDPQGLSFLNMNSPEAYESAVKLWRERNSMTVSVELFGAARMIAKTQLVSVDLPHDANLGQLCSALAQKLPALAGRVVNDEGLAAGYTCNINGLDFVRAPAAKIKSGDKIFILSADAGG